MADKSMQFLWLKAFSCEKKKNWLQMDACVTTRSDLYWKCGIWLGLKQKISAIVMHRHLQDAFELKAYSEMQVDPLYRRRPAVIGLEDSLKDVMVMESSSLI